MRANDVRSNEPIRHGAYVCLSGPPAEWSSAAAAEVPALAARLGLRNEYEPGDDHPAEAVAYLRRVSATPAGIHDEALLRADAIVHVASPEAEGVSEFCAELVRLLPPSIHTYVLGGVVRPMSYTSNTLYNYAYAHRVLQQPGALAPNAFLVPTSKTAAWWEKGFMERHTYILPRYDDDGKMRHEGHALVTEPGISCLMRRTYKHPVEPAPEGSYDFLNYFECADEHVPAFHQVCAALRDTNRNPEWSFVREGPTWQGRRVGTWEALFR